MKYVTIYFPNNICLTQFISDHGLTDIETCSEELSLTGLLTHQQLKTACTKYRATLNASDHVKFKVLLTPVLPFVVACLEQVI